MFPRLTAIRPQQIIHRDKPPVDDFGDPTDAQTHGRQEREVEGQVAQEVADARVPLVRVPRVEDDFGVGEELDQLGEEEGARHVDDAGVSFDRLPHQLERAFLVVGNELGVAGLGPEFDVCYTQVWSFMLVCC